MDTSRNEVPQPEVVEPEEFLTPRRAEPQELRPPGVQSVGEKSGGLEGERVARRADLPRQNRTGSAQQASRYEEDPLAELEDKQQMPTARRQNRARTTREGSRYAEPLDDQLYNALKAELGQEKPRTGPSQQLSQYKDPLDEESEQVRRALRRAELASQEHTKTVPSPYAEDYGSDEVEEPEESVPQRADLPPERQNRAGPTQQRASRYVEDYPLDELEPPMNNDRRAEPQDRQLRQSPRGSQYGDNYPPDEQLRPQRAVLPQSRTRPTRQVSRYVEDYPLDNPEQLRYAQGRQIRPRYRQADRQLRSRRPEYPVYDPRTEDEFVTETDPYEPLIYDDPFFAGQRAMSRQNPLSVRLDLNLEVEVELKLKARVHGDVTLSLLEDGT